MANRLMNASKILVCSLLSLLLAGCILLPLAGCDITLGPKVETQAIIVHPGVPIEILTPQVVTCHLLKDVGNDGATHVFKQNLGGWVAMHPDHWKTIKAEIERLRKKCGE